MAKDQTLNPDFLVSSEEQLRSLFQPTHEIASKKSLDHLDKHARDFIERSPFVCVGTQSAVGTADVSPRGDPCGFVKVLNDKTLLLPDRPGNNRLDTLSNLIANPAIGLLFIVPGYDDTVRVNGRAQLTTDPHLLNMLVVQDRVPTLAIAISVDEVFFHCAKAFRRSKLWKPDNLQNRDEMPSLMQIVHEQILEKPKSADEISVLDAELETDYQNSMY
jgi:hypothetical protein